nr:hypothetical protein [Tanacetum cinerariifolium]
KIHNLAKNPVKEILLKLNLPDHRTLKNGGEGTCFQLSQRFIAACSYPTINDEVLKLKNFKKDASKSSQVIKSRRSISSMALRFLRYIDTRPNDEALRKCILSGPYKPTIVLVQAVDATDDSPAVPEHTTVETPMNISPENKAYF